MSLYRCPECGCKENSALGDFHGANMDKRPVRCSECATGTWHGRFPKVSAAGMLIDDGGGLWTVAQRDAGMIPPAYKIMGVVRSAHEELTDTMMQSKVAKIGGWTREQVLTAFKKQCPTERDMIAAIATVQAVHKKARDAAHAKGSELGIYFPTLGITLLDDGTELKGNPGELH